MSDFATILREGRLAPRIEAPDLKTLLANRERRLLSEINCSTIGTIQSFDAVTQTAQISVNFKRVIQRRGGSNDVSQLGPTVQVGEVIGTLLNPNGTDGIPSESYVSYPALVKCPVVFMSGGAGALTFPIAVGDTCLVIFADRDIDGWFSSGQVGPPNSDRMHDLSDGIALVGIRSLANSLAAYADDKVILKHAASRVVLDSGAGKATLESVDSTVSAEDKVKIAVGVNTLLGALDDLVDALTTAVISGGTFDATTITNLNAAKTAIGAILK